MFHSTGDLGESAILRHLDFGKYLGKLISYLDPVVPDAFHNEFVRCWHAKTDGSAASTFHNNCDGKGPTVTVIKSGSYIFGGYTDQSWQSKYLWERFQYKLSSFLRPSGQMWILFIVISFLPQPEHVDVIHVMTSYRSLTIIRRRRVEYCRVIPETSRGDFSTIFTEPEANNCFSIISELNNRE